MQQNESINQKQAEKQDKAECAKEVRFQIETPKTKNAMAEVGDDTKKKDDDCTLDNTDDDDDDDEIMIQAFLAEQHQGSVIRSEAFAFFTVWSFITRLPSPPLFSGMPNAGHLMRGMAYFPLVGLCIGMFVSTFYDMAHSFLGLPSVVAAALSTAASIWLTGCFHEDGLADTSDGFGGGWSKPQILKIMNDSRLGTYGTATLGLYLITKVQLLGALGCDTGAFFNGGGAAILSQYAFMNSRGAGPALLTAHTLSRWTAPFLSRTRNYIDQGGPKIFYAYLIQAKVLVSLPRVVFATFVSLLVPTLLYGPTTALFLFSITIATAYGAGCYSQSILGGVMGDFLGATICVTEMGVLTGILVRNNLAVVFFEQPFSFQNIVALSLSSWQNPRFVALIKFVVIILFTLWWRDAFKYVETPKEETGTNQQEQQQKNGDANQQNDPVTSTGPEILFQQTFEPKDAQSLGSSASEILFEQSFDSRKRD